MSLVNVLRSGVSGMNAQSNRISTVAENIQNASTTGYKRTSTEFSSLLIDGSGQGDYNSGAVETAIRRSIGQDGPTLSTTSDSDLAISGKGFFVVKDAGGAPFLTRAGNFVVDGPTGNLVNAGGFTLQGYSLANGEPNPVLNGIADLQPINVSRLGLEARPSTEARISGNLSFTTPVLSTVATPTTHVDLSGGLPGNTAVLPVGTSPPSGTTYSFKRSVEANDDKGRSLPLDVYLTRVDGKKWLVSAYDGSNTSAFPADPLMATEIEFANFEQQQTFSGSLTIPGGQFTDFSFSLIQRAATTPPAAADNTPNLSLTDDGHVEFDPLAYSKKSSISVVNNVGQKTSLDLYFRKAGPDMWIVNIYDAANGSSYPATPLTHDVLRFDGDGQLSKGGPLSVAVPNGQTMKIDITALTQLASGTALSGTANGMEPTAMTGMAFGSDGTVYANFADGTRAATYKVPLADVASSDNLTPRAGNVYATSPTSGDVQIGFAGQGSRGTLKSKALEQSNVDVSSELTSMIEAQTIYTASSKVFMTGAELLDAIVNLKR